jgi:hypothetical protein
MNVLWPGFLWALVLVPLALAAYLLAQRRRARYAVRFTNLDLLANVVTRSPGWRRHLPPAFYLLALTGLLVSLARPQAVTLVPKEQATVMLVMDVSGSMNATDVQPTRMVAAQQSATTFVEELPKKLRVGVVSFASTAQTLTRPTIDRVAVYEAIATLHAEGATAMGDGIERALLAQFHPLEEALAAMGVVVWPMIELEADDALASAAHLASQDKEVQKVAIWTPDKDLAQCVRGTRVVQIDGRRKAIRDAAGIREKFGVDPPLIPDLLALVGDAADGYPGIPGVGARTAAQLLNRYGQIENFPPKVLGEQRDLALLFKNLATLRTDAPLFDTAATLHWSGATPAFATWADRMEAPRLLERCEKAAGR